MSFQEHSDHFMSTFTVYSTQTTPTCALFKWRFGNLGTARASTVTGWNSAFRRGVDFGDRVFYGNNLVNHHHKQGSTQASTSETNMGSSMEDGGLRETKARVSSLLVPQHIFHQNNQLGVTQVGVKATKTDSAAVSTYL